MAGLENWELVRSGGDELPGVDTVWGVVFTIAYISQPGFMGVCRLEDEISEAVEDGELECVKGAFRHNLKDVV